MKRCSVLATGELGTDHVTALERLHGAVTVDRRCADLAELLAAARNTRADAALIVGGTEQLTSAVLAGLAQQGLTVVAISEVATERSRLAGLGAMSFSDEVPVQQLAEALADHEPQDAEATEAPAQTRGEAEEFIDLMEAGGLLVPPEDDAAAPAQMFNAQAPQPITELAGITTVWGASGAPGRTTVAVNLAAELVLAGARTLLIDADTYGSAVAVHLGLLQESAGLAQACRAADLARLDSATLAAATSSVMLDNRRLAVLTGLPRAHRWTELRAHGLELVLAQARVDYDHIIIDVAPWIEEDEELALDSYGSAPQRNTAARTALAHADTILALGGGDPVGFSRLVKAVQELGETLAHAPPARVIISQLRKDVIGRSPRRQLSDAWEQLGPGGSIHSYLAWDQPACDAALRAGVVLAESAEDSALRRQIAALAGVELAPRRRLFAARAFSRRGRAGGLETPAGRR